MAFTQALAHGGSTLLDAFLADGRFDTCPEFIGEFCTLNDIVLVIILDVLIADLDFTHQDLAAVQIGQNRILELSDGLLVFGILVDALLFRIEVEQVG